MRRPPQGGRRSRARRRSGGGIVAPSLTETEPASADIARFLRAHPPFDALEPAQVERVAAAVEIESHPAGATIFSQGAEPVEHLRVIVSGSVEIAHDGRVLDLLGEGELFGHASMLSGLPPGFQARAAEQTVCYRIGEDVARELLAAPAGLRYVVRSLIEVASDLADGTSAPVRHAADTPVGALIRGQPVLCEPNTPIREVARMMTDGPASAAIVKLEDGAIGILTDRDLRMRVVANDMSGNTPVREAMTAPAYTCRPDRLGGDALLEMLDRGFRHFPVVSADGEIQGLIEDLDIVAGQARSSFFLRQRIGRAHSVDELVVAARELRPAVIGLHDARVAATNIMSVYAVVVDALTRRLLELAVQEAGGEPPQFAWLALGSQARREAAPSSDVDSAIVWFGQEAEDEVRPYLHHLGQTVVEGLERCGLRQDEHGASASNLLFIRSLESWQHAARSWIDDPTQYKALLLASVLVDSRPVWGVHTGTPVADTFRLAPRNPALLRMLARYALSYRPPTGFLRGLVVEHSGEHRGRLDLKHGGVIPIVGLARWAGMTAGVTNASTTERLSAAAAGGTLSSADAHTLREAFELINGLRISHQVRQLRSGDEPDDHVDPGSLSELTRSHLREAFRAVAAVQKRVSSELSGPLP